jgi:AraC-like DNA-binding protein
MTYRLHVPGPPLCESIELMWFGDDYSVPHALERVLPTGDMSLIINLHEDRTRVYSQFTVIDTAEQRSTVGVVFKPGGASPFFGLPASELQDTDASLDTLWGAEARFLREQLLEAKTPDAKFAAFERALRNRMNRASVPAHPAVRFAVGNFRREPNRAISTVTDQLGLSERRFIQLFAQQVGLTPKLYCRVQRFQRVLRHIARSRECIDWTDIALTCGYFDQAHFIHDFRAFSGINPSSYVANKTQFQNHVAL